MAWIKPEHLPRQQGDLAEPPSLRDAEDASAIRDVVDLFDAERAGIAAHFRGRPARQLPLPAHLLTPQREGHSSASVALDEALDPDQGESHLAADPDAERLGRLVPVEKV